VALQKKYAIKAVSFKPATGDAYSVMSDVLWEEKDTAGALSILRNAINREPDNVGNYIFMAIRYGQTGKKELIDSALFFLHQIRNLDPEYGQAYMKLGNVYHWRKYIPDSAKYYYRKALDVYYTVKPRDNRMMDGYFWLGELYKSEKQYDSALYYYQLLLNEIEPSDLYMREVRLSMAYRAMYECYQGLATTRLDQFTTLNEKRIASNSDDPRLLASILEDEGYMMIEQEAFVEKYTLPLTKRVQKITSRDPYITIFAACDESLSLKRLKRNKEAMEVLQAAYAKHPNEPLILFELGRAAVSNNKVAEGISYLRQSKQHLNGVIKREYYLAWLTEPDFDKVRNMPAFKKLLE
jgi:tetratricopeptide (TPR) repeat protein